MTTEADRQRLDAARNAARTQIAGLEATFAEIVASSELVATDDEHDPEGHTIAFERQQVAALLRDARMHLADLDAAIERLDVGTYGSCEVCGGPIGSARLDALPGATRCIGCAVTGAGTPP